MEETYIKYIEGVGAVLTPQGAQCIERLEKELDEYARYGSAANIALNYEERDRLVIDNQSLRASLAHKDHLWDDMRHKRDEAVKERDHSRRLFNRLEAAITHHHNNKSMHFSDEVDDALYEARDRVLRDSAKGVQ